MEATFRAGGLATGIDTNSMIDKLVSIESGGITRVQRRQAAYRTQISDLGEIISKLQTLGTAASGLASDGVLGVQQVGSTSGYSATPTSAATAGRFSVIVDSLAQAAKARSNSFAATTSPVRGGTLSLGVNGTNYDITIGDGDSLETVAKAINDSDAPVSAAVLDTGSGAFLSISNRDVGFTVGQPAASALTITETSTGALGQPLGLAITQTASNAVVHVDGLRFERNSNTMTGVVPGVTLGLNKPTTVAEDLVLNTSAESTKTNLQKFVDAYNGVMKGVRNELNVGEQTDRTQTLAGDPSMRSLQASLQSLLTRPVSSSSGVRTLADLGIKTTTDGTLTIDSARLDKAISTDSAAVNALFQTASTGVGAAVKTIATAYTNIVDGVLVTKKAGLEKSIKQADKTIEALQLRVDKYKERLIAQFSAMETTVSGFKNMGNYLTSLEKKTST